jgi:sulfur carrier protein
MTDFESVQPLVRVNGEQEPLRARTIAALLAEKEMPAGRKGIAVALNGRVVPRGDWNDTPLAAGDTVEIVLARHGG